MISQIQEPTRMTDVARWLILNPGSVSEPQEQQRSTKLPNFSWPWLVPAPVVLRLGYDVPCGAGSRSHASPSWLALACVLATWPLPPDLPAPRAVLGQPPWIFSPWTRMWSGLLWPGIRLPQLPCPSPSWQRFCDKGVLGRLASFQLVRVDFRSGFVLSLLLGLSYAISSGHERLPSDRSMVPGLRCHNSNPVCEILGNIPISFKSRLPHLNNETCNRIYLTAVVQTEPEHGKGFLRHPAENKLITDLLP